MPRSQQLRPLFLVWGLASAVVLAYSLRLDLFIAPTEATMGNIYRIFYWHVPVNIVAFIFPYVNLAGSVWLLATRNSRPSQALIADAVAQAAAEITVLFSSLGLLTGMLWARPVWGIWWTWDARLTSALLLWVLYVAYLLLRRFSYTGHAATVAAILSVFAAIDVPISYMSISWWRTQHPSPVIRGDGKLDSSMWPALLWSFAGWLMWAIFLFGLRFALERRRQIDAEDQALNALGTLPLEVHQS